MMKKIVSLAVAMVCASNLVLATISSDDSAAAMLAGKAHAEKMLKEGKTEELNAELNEAANGLSTLSLEGNQKALWFLAGATAAGAVVLGWWGIPKAYTAIKTWRANRAAAAPVAAAPVAAAPAAH